MEALGITLIFIGIILFLSKLLTEPLNKNYPHKNKNIAHNFAIIIPARDESKVIEELLISIENQTEKIDNKNVYVIIENKSDPTYEIVKKHKMNIFIRQKLNLKRKGYALMELIEDLEQKKKYYDAYFIFDADNVLDKNYIKEMTKTYNEGYDIGIGYRNNKNKNNVISTCSSLIFSILNVVGNERKNKTTINKTLSGTGFYIKGDLIKKWKTYPFHTLTEDYEFTLYSIVNNLTSYYNKNAKYYDEQPTTYKDYKTQRTRWIKGYFEARKLYRKDLIKNFNLTNKNISSVHKELIGVWDIIIIIIGFVLTFFDMFIKIIEGKNYINIILGFLTIIFLIYISLVFLTIWLLCIENKNFNLTNKMILKTSLMHPLLLAAYIPCAIKALFTKNLEWNKIEHKEALKE